MFVGRVFTEEGVRLIPSHTVKGGRRYRYFVAAPGAKKKIRIPASDLEKPVLDRLRSFLAASGEVVQALGVATDAHEQNEIVLAAKEWVKVADGSPRSTQMSDCVTRVVVGPTNVKVECSATRLRSQLLVMAPSTETADSRIDAYVR